MIHLGLVGYPLGHSRSPKIHTEMLAQCGLAGDYRLFPVPLDDIALLNKKLSDVRKGRLNGLNITIPHKQNIIPLLDMLSASAQLVGAVNTVYLKDGRLVGENTDLPGFLTGLKTKIFSDETISSNKHAIVLGAGGAARAAVGALLEDGWRIMIAARRQEQSAAVIKHFQEYESNLKSADLSLEGISAYGETTRLIVNATPVGMHPKNGASPWPIGLPFPHNARVYDLVYNPKETQLIRDAKKAGLKATSGMGMLIEQAVIAFEIWTGCQVNRDKLISSLEEE